MKVIIANPPWIIESKNEKKFGVRATSRWPHLRNDKILPFPIFHAYASTIMENAGIEVKAIDAADQEMSIPKFVEEMVKFNPDYIFIDISYSSYEYDKRTIRELEKKSNVKIVVFGPDATARAEFIMNDCKEIDFVVYGEYDFTLRDLVLSKEVSNVRGIYYRSRGKIIKTKERMLIENLDELPFPARHLYSPDSYQEPLCHKPQHFIITSRGCPFGCSFCLYPQTMSGGKLRTRSAKNIVDEMEYLIKKLGAKTINIDDDTFTANPKRVKGICDEIIRRELKFKWQCWSSVNIQDDEMYRKMKQAGCEMVKFGVESASLATQQNIGKNLNIEKIKNSFRIRKKQGFKTFGTFMFGLPGDTKDSMEDTIKLAIELNPFAVQFSYAVAFPGTKLYVEAEKKGWLIKKNHDGFAGCFEPSILPKGLKLSDIEGKVQQAYKRFYLRPGYLVKMIVSSRNLNDFKRLSWGMKTLLNRLLN